jgi:hypothetical protein
MPKSGPPIVTTPVSLSSVLASSLAFQPVRLMFGNA